MQKMNTRDVRPILAQLQNNNYTVASLFSTEEEKEHYSDRTSHVLVCRHGNHSSSSPSNLKNHTRSNIAHYNDPGEITSKYMYAGFVQCLLI